MIKVVIIGPESTGKSTLCQQLADHYNTLWCPEYAREYLEANGKDYTYDDLLTIAKGQLALEDRYTTQLQSAIDLANKDANIPLFIDTDMHVMSVWCEFVFGKCHPFIYEQIKERHYDLYLLCNTDLPWVEDALREYPDVTIREELYGIYKQKLLNQTTPWVSIQGTYQQRFETAVKAMDEMLKK